MAFSRPANEGGTFSYTTAQALWPGVGNSISLKIFTLYLHKDFVVQCRPTLDFPGVDYSFCGLTVHNYFSNLLNI
jgi:hypothetical protein